MRSSIDGLTAEALNWRPVGDANSIAVLVTHTLGATRLWLRLALGLPLPERDRDSEFSASAEDAEAFQRFVSDLSEDCLGVLGSAAEVDWTEMRLTHGRGGDAPPEVAAAYALIHATEHLRGHVDQMALTRQLWEAWANK